MGFPSVDWQGLVLPVAYLLVLGGTFAAFSTIYRRRKAVQSASLSPWFPPHLQRNVYLSLLHMEPEPGSDKPQKVPDTVLRAALLRRAVEDIHRIIQIRTGKQACQSLLQRGSVGDDLWQRFLRAEKEMEDELRDVVMEANALVPNWGQIIFQTANAIAANELLRTKLDAVQDKAAAEKAWWEKRKLSMPPSAGGEATAATLTEDAKGPSSPTGASKTSEDDTVLVDTPSAATAPAPTPASTHPTPSGKKKKGKK
ncbi:translocation protein SEC66 [Sporothrix brasiliensis 5110]|uniref:Translocation protein SEC66 n=1 Tax=Sporothrix brasiliensis 5110 TaxID=1398154 RepID=A0A0C2IF33_9PEZI|nr:translocation protein SEC66 [Sporothrix brasiliensis 5110]KIH87826.1 translocation protein SEC66 [Sporothrix brasiliensis 5110]